MLDGHGTGHYYDYREVKEHAGREFPFNIYPCSIPLDFKQVQVHWHEELEIISVKKGRGGSGDIPGTASRDQPVRPGGDGI